MICRTNELVYTLVPIKRRSRTYVTCNAGSQAWRVARTWALRGGGGGGGGFSPDFC